jgi:nitrite reductase/ring-hydroxylating ferredoxin subunit
MYVRIADLADLTEGRPKMVRVRGRELVLTLWRGEVFATRSICPHQHASLAEGIVRQRIVHDGELGQLALDPEEAEITCPWHAWPFNLRTGQCTVDPQLRIRSYPVKVEAGAVLVDM